MKIIDKLALKAENIWDNPAVTIAFLGDSVTQGCFELCRKGEGITTVFDQSSAYHRYVAQILATLYPSAPVNVINAGVSGGSAPHGLNRLERDVIAHQPDLTVVCFGLNDCHRGAEYLSLYVESLQGIFTKLQEAGSEIIFMTPNMMCNSVSDNLGDERYRDIAVNTVKVQNEGGLDLYLDAAKDLCTRMGVKVCDCYAKWKALERGGANITELLANKINHPTREMNWMFAYSLVETMFG